MNNADIRERLYDKIQNEYEEYINYLKKLPPSEIISQAYKKVVYEDLLAIFEYENIYDTFSEEQMLKLLELNNPLYECYDKWMDTDYSHMEDMRYTVLNFADELIEEG